MWVQRVQVVYTETQKDDFSSPAQHVCLLSHNFTTVLTETAKRDGGKRTCRKEETTLVLRLRGGSGKFRSVNSKFRRSS
jgi:hypothetical protein